MDWAYWMGQKHETELKRFTEKVCLEARTKIKNSRGNFQDDWLTRLCTTDIPDEVKRSADNDIPDEVKKSASKGSKSLLTKSDDVIEGELDKADTAFVNDYSFPFENLVLAGGGAKGLAYCRVCRAFEKNGILPNIKRFAGTSAGSIAALLFAIGCNSHDLERLLSVDLDELIKDASWGYLSFIPNLLWYFGWNPGKRILDYLGDILDAKGYHPDSSFAELYAKDNIELCVVVTNVDTMREEYCHVKTTPDMPVRQAVRMSLSIPGLFQAVQYKMYQEPNYYVDGGLICNYPIHCFDGWWLSMADRDDFLHKLDSMYDFVDARDMSTGFKYKSGDLKTLGCLVYSEHEQVINKERIENISGVPHDPSKPKTDRAEAFVTEQNRKDLLDAKYKSLTKAGVDLCMGLKEYAAEGKITREEFCEVFEKQDILSEEYRNMLFGKDCDRDEAFDAIDRDNDGIITPQQLFDFLDEAGLSLQRKYLGKAVQKIRSLKDFILTIFTGLSTHVNSTFIKDLDVYRSVGINTRYITTLDFSMEEDDKKFLIKQGEQCTERYLRNFKDKHPEYNSDQRMKIEGPTKGHIPEDKLKKLLNKYSTENAVVSKVIYFDVILLIVVTCIVIVVII